MPTVIARIETDARVRGCNRTSFAAAQVSALLARLLERRPQLTPAEARRTLEAATPPREPGGRDPALGAGVVDACRLLGEPC